MTSSSLNWRYSGTVSSSKTRWCTLTLTYSHTPGLSRRASATQGGETMASYRYKLISIYMHVSFWWLYQYLINQNSQDYLIYGLTCVDLRTSAKAPSSSFNLSSLLIASNSARSWWGFNIPFPWLSILKFNIKYQQSMKIKF